MVFEAGASVWTTCPSDVCGVVQRDNLWTILCVPCACLWCNETSPLRLCGKKGARERAVKTQLGGCVSPTVIGGRFPATAVGQAGAITLRSRARSEHDQGALFLCFPSCFDFTFVKASSICSL